jgi:hypothetical protein
MYAAAVKQFGAVPIPFVVPPPVCQTPPSTAGIPPPTSESGCRVFHCHHRSLASLNGARSARSTQRYITASERTSAPPAPAHTMRTSTIALVLNAAVAAAHPQSSAPFSAPTAAVFAESLASEPASSSTSSRTSKISSIPGTVVEQSITSDTSTSVVISSSSTAPAGTLSSLLPIPSSTYFSFPTSSDYSPSSGVEAAGVPKALAAVVVGGLAAILLVMA